MSFSIYNRTKNYINSDYRISGSSSNFTYQIVIPNDQTYAYDRVCVMNLRIPKSYYLINSTNNRFILNQNGVSTDVYMTVGNYTINAFLIELKLRMDAVNGAYTYTVAIPNSATEPDTGKIEFYSNNVLPSSLTFVVDNVNNPNSSSKLADIMGFDVGTTGIFSNTITLYSTSVYHFHGYDTLFLKSNICSNHDNIMNNPILLDINTSEGFFTDIYFTCPDIDGYSRELNTIDSGLYTFTLTDIEDNVIDLNGKEIVFSLVFYKFDNTNELTRELTKIKESQILNGIPGFQNDYINPNTIPFMGVIDSSTPNIENKLILKK